MTMLHRICASVGIAVAGTAHAGGGIAYLSENPCKNHYILESPAECAWSKAAPMNAARQRHTATLLRDGRVLVVGGNHDNQLVDPPSGRTRPSGPDGAEIFDPLTGEWTRTAPLNRARTGHTATLLEDGRVLVVGGESNYHHTALWAGTAEIFDPRTGTWALTPLMIDPWVRAYHTATLLADGKVLVVGGTEEVNTRTFSAEMYDPALDRWATVEPPQVDRYGHAAIALADGTLLISSGITWTDRETLTNSAEVFDPATRTWSPVRPALVPSAGQTATRLIDGRVLSCGGWSGGFGGGAACQLYDPLARAWTQIASLRVPRVGHTATLMSDGSVLVVGGALGPVELRGPDLGPTRFIEALREPRWFHTATRLLDGSILVVGGRGADGRNLNSAELLEASAAK